jgi:hypothetical protein
MPASRKLMYSRQKHDRKLHPGYIHDRREFGKYVYKPHFLDIIAARCTRDIEEAKKRVQISEGKYKFTPSREYIQFLKRHTKVKRK